MDISLLVKLTARAWSLPVLAAMNAGTPGRLAALLQVTGAGRGALGQSLDHLIGLGLLQRCPGHGHPLRPEFRLTDEGAAVAAVAHDLMRVTPPPEQRLLRRTWTLPVLRIVRAPVAFSQIRHALPITDRALSQSLHMLERERWILREIKDGRPPRPLYRAHGTGQSLATLVA